MALYPKRDLQFACEMGIITMSYCERGYLKLDRVVTQMWGGSYHRRSTEGAGVCVCVFCILT